MLWGLTTVVIRSTALARVSAHKLLFYQVALSAVVLPMLSLMLGETWRFDMSSFAWTSLAIQTVVGALPATRPGCGCLGRHPATRISVLSSRLCLRSSLVRCGWGARIRSVAVGGAGLVAVGIVLVNQPRR